MPASGPGIVGGQGRTAQEVTWSAEAGLVAVMAAGFVLLVVALGYVAGVAL